METVLRVAIIYFLLLVGLRILGKREFSQLSALELLTLLLIPELVAQSLVREDFSFVNALIAVSTLFSLVYFTSLARYLSDPLEKVMSGEPCILVSEGRFLEQNLDRERVDAHEIFSEMRKAGLAELQQVKWAILESDGKISIIARDGAETQVRPGEDRVVG
jgi:uncharacterized membrane protein YcaP (DUF421 family)